jgi:hypothetical protein
MENTNNTNVNVVSIPLSDYNVLNINLSNTRDLLAKTTTELEVLKNQNTTDTSNKIIVYEKQKQDRWGKDMGVSERLVLDVEDATVSAKLLDVISKVETSELSQQIKDKNDEIKTLKTVIDTNQESLDRLERANRNSFRSLEETTADKIRKLKKSHDEKIEELETDKETISKALADLKKDKTQQQIEFARQEEITQLNDKLDALNNFKSTIDSLKGDPKGIKRFLEGVQASEKARIEWPWIDKMWKNIYAATNAVDNFVRMIKEVGNTKKECDCTPIPVNNWFYGNDRPHYVCYECGSDDVGEE